MDRKTFVGNSAEQCIKLPHPVNELDRYEINVKLGVIMMRCQSCRERGV